MVEGEYRSDPKYAASTSMRRSRLEPRAARDAAFGIQQMHEGTCIKGTYMKRAHDRMHSWSSEDRYRSVSKFMQCESHVEHVMILCEQAFHLT